jgi:hypothetical protein
MKKLLQYLLDLIASWFTDQDYSLGEIIYAAPSNWKLSAVADTTYGQVVCIYDNKSRHDSKIFLNGKEIHSGYEETIGQPVEMANLYFAGECGTALIWYVAESRIIRGEKLKYATCAVQYKGVPYVINTVNPNISAINCYTGKVDFTLPAKNGIVLMAAEGDDGLLYAACNGGPGILISDQTVVDMPDCRCVINYRGRIIASSGNRLYQIEGKKKSYLDELPCEKIMHLDVAKDLLWVAGPNSLWTYNQVLRRRFVGKIGADYEVGNSAFGARVTGGRYFGWAEGGTSGRVCKIEEG